MDPLDNTFGLSLLVVLVPAEIHLLLRHHLLVQAISVKMTEMVSYGIEYPVIQAVAPSILLRGSVCLHVPVLYAWPVRVLMQR